MTVDDRTAETAAFAIRGTAMIAKQKYPEAADGINWMLEVMSLDDSLRLPEITQERAELIVSVLQAVAS